MHNIKMNFVISKRVPQGISKQASQTTNEVYYQLIEYKKPTLTNFDWIIEQYQSQHSKNPHMPLLRKRDSPSCPKPKEKRPFDYLGLTKLSEIDQMVVKFQKKFPNPRPGIERLRFTNQKQLLRITLITIQQLRRHHKSTGLLSQREWDIIDENTVIYDLAEQFSFLMQTKIFSYYSQQPVSQYQNYEKRLKCLKQHLKDEYNFQLRRKLLTTLTEQDVVQMTEQCMMSSHMRQKLLEQQEKTLRESGWELDKLSYSNLDQKWLSLAKSDTTIQDEDKDYKSDQEGFEIIKTNQSNHKKSLLELAKELEGQLMGKAVDFARRLTEDLRKTTSYALLIKDYYEEIPLV